MNPLKERAIKISLLKRINKYAQVVELVDTRDLKSLDRNIVPVQVRLWAPTIENYEPRRFNRY